jgi:hypothetical protein
LLTAVNVKTALNGWSRFERKAPLARDQLERLLRNNIVTKENDGQVSPGR